jgi:hypothetical protein
MLGANARDSALIQGQLWTPHALRGAGKLAGWWDAGDIAQITMATGVSALRDKAGLQNAAMATTTIQPSWSALGWRGFRPSMNTAALAKYLLFSGIAYNGTNGMSGMFAVQQNGAAVYRAIISGTTGSPQIRFDNDSKVTVLRTVQANIATSPSAVATGYHLVGFDIGTNLTRIWVDGVAVVDGVANGAYTQPFNCLCEDNGVGGTDFQGSWGAGVVSALKWSTIERQQVEGYLAWEWDGGVAGLLVSQLPANHPYKSRPPLIGGALRLRRPAGVNVPSGFSSRYYYDMARAA